MMSIFLIVPIACAGTTFQAYTTDNNWQDNELINSLQSSYLKENTQISSETVLATTDDENERSRNIPIVLVHGLWSNSETFSKLEKRLNEAGISTWNFDYEENNIEDPRKIAIDLVNYINEKRRINRYYGEIDIIAHSMGALITRWYMEELEEGNANVRQWIGIAPVTGGIAIMDLYDYSLFNIFLRIFELDNEGGALHQLSTNSETVETLNANIPDNLNKGTIYRVIVGSNPTQSAEFMSMYGIPSPATIEKTGNSYTYTYQGDGIIANNQSFFHYYGELIDVLYSDDEPAKFNHVSIQRQEETIQKILEHYSTPRSLV